ncbi:hypothetical protein TPA0907_29840 [Micromonospora humidisoli]|nr:hypothetical protein TPA0907_29840 [Micromonospora sp. AKA109]
MEDQQDGTEQNRREYAEAEAENAPVLRAVGFRTAAAADRDHGRSRAVQSSSPRPYGQRKINQNQYHLVPRTGVGPATTTTRATTASRTPTPPATDADASRSPVRCSPPAARSSCAMPTAPGPGPE